MTLSTAKSYPTYRTRYSFDSGADGAYLQRTFTGVDNRQQMIISSFIRNDATLGPEDYIYLLATTGSGVYSFARVGVENVSGTDYIVCHVVDYDGATLYGVRLRLATFNTGDLINWNHIYIEINTTEANEDDRVTGRWNGGLILATEEYGTWIPQNHNMLMGDVVRDHYINFYATNRYAKFADYHLFYLATQFDYSDFLLLSSNNVVYPRKPRFPSFGNVPNCRLQFLDPDNLGEDSSPNNQDWNVVGDTASQSTDVPGTTLG